MENTFNFFNIFFETFPKFDDTSLDKQSSSDDEADSFSANLSEKLQYQQLNKYFDVQWNIFLLRKLFLMLILKLLHLTHFLFTGSENILWNNLQQILQEIQGLFLSRLQENY